MASGACNNKPRNEEFVVSLSFFMLVLKRALVVSVLFMIDEYSARDIGLSADTFMTFYFYYINSNLKGFSSFLEMRPG